MHEAEQLTDFETMRSIGVRVGSSEQEIRLFAAYRPPGTKMCVQDIHAIIQEQTPTLIIGDLNAKHKAWGSHSISRAGRLLMEDAERQGYEVLGPDTPTHVPTDIRHRPDVLDIVIGHKIRRSMHVEVMYGYATPAHPRDGRVRHLQFATGIYETTRGLETIRVVLRDTAPRFLLRDRRRRRGVCQLTGEKDKRGTGQGHDSFADFDVPSRRPAPKHQKEAAAQAQAA
ncbi:hypothetical protein EVAR_23741_1 [Eumeta japonica]|uniref:Endonuclease/exonuclease/phosphatase domain-containing protein n=1 Tax=Eumeta variegata TaxID=151549 RepID=A0A4C1VH75_EUMVA|nr:hypothetical protein EVAR_23741_1 [Eumeta japonica]